VTAQPGRIKVALIAAAQEVAHCGSAATRRVWPIQQTGSLSHEKLVCNFGRASIEHKVNIDLACGLSPVLTAAPYNYSLTFSANEANGKNLINAMEKDERYNLRMVYNVDAAIDCTCISPLQRLRRSSVRAVPAGNTPRLSPAAAIAG
jgi:hypothetical protein